MRVAVVGQGYVGITAAACLATAGHEVVGVERDEERLAQLRAAVPPVYEPGLPELLREAIEQRRLGFSASLTELREPMDAVIVAVGTPPLPSGGADLRPFVSALGDIEAMRQPPRLVVVKSTVPPGTSTRVLAEAAPDSGLRARYVVSPEFLSLGSALSGWNAPSRIVVGTNNHQGLLPDLRELYRGIEAPWIITTPTSAEMIKYASNAYLATKISFVNEIANLCEAVDAHIDDVVQGMASDPRIGPAYLQAGAGYGGSCFPKDTRALIHRSSLEGRSMPLVEAAIHVNNAQRLRLVRIVRDVITRPGASVAVLGLSFKPGTDDLREAPSLTVVSELLSLGYRVRAWDPVVTARAAEAALPGADVCDDIESALEDAQGAVVLTEWPEIKAAPWSALVARMAEPRFVLDGRNCLDPQQIAACGGLYRGVGRCFPGAVSAILARDERRGDRLMLVRDGLRQPDTRRL